MKQTLSHGAGHSAASYKVTLHKYTSTAQTFTVYAPSEVSFCFVYCVSVFCVSKYAKEVCKSFR